MPAKKKEPLPAILAATDFSDNAASAAAVAGAVAAQLGAPLYLVHSVILSPSDFRKKTEWTDFLDSMQKRLNDELHKLSPDNPDSKAVLLAGTIAEEALLKQIKQTSPAMTVVASVSKTTWDRWTIGSMSEAIAERSPAPTLVVRDAAVLLNWAAGKAPLRVFVAFDFSESAQAALEWVEQLRQIGPCDVTVGHIYCPPEETSRRGLPPAETFMAEPKGLHDDIESACRKKVEKALGKNGATVIAKPSFSRPDFPIIELAHARKADLLVAGTRQRQGLSRLWNASISRGLLHHAKLTVAIVPAAKKPRDSKR